MTDPTSAKRELRSEMLALRRSLPDRAERSERLWRFVEGLDAVREASVIMVFDAVPGEPITAPFIERRRAAGQRVMLPEDTPAPDPAIVDVVIVPGTAFTARGERLGQGGGWYDRFLPETRSECVTIGVGFEPQLVEFLPVEPHDVVLDLVVTDRGPSGGRASMPRISS